MDMSLLMISMNYQKIVLLFVNLLLLAKKAQLLNDQMQEFI